MNMQLTIPANVLALLQIWGACVTIVPAVGGWVLFRKIDNVARNPLPGRRIGFIEKDLEAMWEFCFRLHSWVKSQNQSETVKVPNDIDYQKIKGHAFWPEGKPTQFRYWLTAPGEANKKLSRLQDAVKRYKEQN